MSNFNARQGISVGSPAVNVVDASGNVTATSFTGPGTGLTAIPVTALATTGTASATTYLNGAGAYTTPATGSAASLTTTLTGYAMGTDASQLAATDNILTGFQKLEAQENTLANQLASAQSSSLGNAIGPWQSYTPTWSAATTNPVLGNGTLTGYYRRVGDSAEISITLTTGSTTTYGTGSWYFSIPTGLSANATLTSGNNLGVAKGFCAGGTFVGYDVDLGSNTTLVVLGPSSGYITSSYPGPWVSANSLSIKATIPIAQWTANINLLTSFTEYAYNTSTTTTSDTTSFGYGSGGALIQAFAPTGENSVNKSFQFLQPIQPADLITLELNVSGYGWLPVEYTQVGFGFNPSNSTFFGAFLGITSSSGGYAGFCNMATPTNTWATVIAGNPSIKWRVRKTSQGNFAQGSPSYSTTIGNASATSFTVTHNLGTPIYSVTAWETTGSLRQITSGVVVSNPTSTTVTLTFTTAPALNAVQVLVQSNGGTVSNNDRLSNLANPELTISAAATASTAQWNRCYATSAAYALTLPPVLANAGKIVAVRIDPSSAFNVTVTGNGSDLIDGSNTYLMIPKECCEFKSDGTTWQRISNNTVDGTWTPVPTNLTVVGTPTYTGRYKKIGNMVFFYMGVTSTTSTTSSNGSSLLSLPFVGISTWGGNCTATNATSGTSLPTGYTWLGNLYLPSWTALAAVSISGSFAIA